MGRFLCWMFLMLIFTVFGEISSKVRDPITTHPNWKLLNSDRCGISNFDRIVGGINAPMGAYPWIARIGYVSPPSTRVRFVCAGAVINELYVITAAHCVTNIPQKMVPVRIRLGEHKTDTDPDCELSFCNDPHQDYNITEVVSHKKFSRTNSKNDIALIRLHKQITFTDFVRPICIVKGRLLQKNFVGSIVEVAGWGDFDIMDPRPSKVLKAVKLPVLPIDRCRNDSYYEDYSIDSNQMCIGGKPGQDSCEGDSGGPVMKVEVGDEGALPRYYVIGIVSFGPGACGHNTTPAVYTNLSKYILWVLEHLRA